MTATEGNLLQFLGPMAQFSIPVYQRTYTWTRAQCEQLWKDVLASSERSAGHQHFIGAVVYIEQKETVYGNIPAFLVIDGQQRLTTVSLLLAALCERLSDSDREETRSQYLVNGLTKDPEKRRKLILTQRDRDTLFRIAEGTPLPHDPSPGLVSNFEYFRERLADSGIDPRKVLRGLERLQFVNVKLRQDVDDPQLIFESLNATGVKLSQSDLVRNTLLMGLPTLEQQAVYEQAWHPLERLMLAEADPERFDNMLRDFLGGERGALVNQRALHDEVRRRLREGVGRGELARSLYDFGRAWYAVAVEASGETAGVRTALDRVRAVSAGVAYPFLARLLYRLRRESGDLAELIDAAEWTEAYVMRRLLAQVATNTMNRTFIVFARDCPTVSVQSWLAERTARLGYTQRFPTDEEILTSLQTRDVYSMKTRGYLLERLENEDNKDLIRASNYTLEHVMPQNPELSEAWRDELGPDWQGVQARRLHTLGNLTLTGYNSELSDRPFAEKKTMKGGFNDSPVRLSRSLREAAQWNEQAILARGEELGRAVLRIWPRPAAMPPQSVSEGPEASRKREFWAELLAASAELTPLFEGKQPTDQVHVSTTAGFPGLWFQFWVQANGARVNLSISRDDGDENRRIFEHLLSFRRQVEADFESPLNWRELPEHRSCGIDWRIDVGSESDPEEVQAAIPLLAQRMAALEQALSLPLASLREVNFNA